LFGIIKDVRIEALATSLSKKRMTVEERVGDLIKPKRLARVIAGTGVEKLSIVQPGISASDLCVASAERIFDEGIVKREDIGAVFFVTQRPDYPLPATSYCIQDRLGLGTDIMAFDVNCSCPGFVYGIHIAASMLSNLGKKVLLCCGDVTSNPEDTNPTDTAFMTIMGDAASVAILGRTAESAKKKIYYNIDSYGDRFKKLYEPRGAARERKRTTADGERIIEPENYTIMDGMAITDFTLKEVPDNIMALLKYAELSKDDVDIALVHQANGLIVNSLAEKLGMSSEVMPFKCANIGNTDMASIPTAMTELKKDGADYTKYHKALLSGFGAGLSVASMIMDLSDINILPTNEI